MDGWVEKWVDRWVEREGKRGVHAYETYEVKIQGKICFVIYIAGKKIIISYLCCDCEAKFYKRFRLYYSPPPSKRSVTRSPAPRDALHPVTELTFLTDNELSPLVLNKPLRTRHVKGVLGGVLGGMHGWGCHGAAARVARRRCMH